MAPTMPIPPDAEARLKMLESTVSDKKKKTESNASTEESTENQARESL